MNSSTSFKPVAGGRRSRSPLRRYNDLPVRLKLAFMFVVAIVSSIVAVGIFVDQRSSAQLREDVGERLDNRVEVRAQVVADWANQHANELSTLSLGFIQELRTLSEMFASEEEAQAHVAEFLEAEASELLPPASQNAESLQAYINLSPTNQQVLVTDGYGVLVAASDRVSQYVYADEDWWQQAWNGGRGATYVSDPQPFGDDKLMIVSIAVPVRDPRTDDLLGVIQGYYAVEALYELVEAITIGQTGHAILIFPGAQIAAEESRLEALNPDVRDQLAVVVDQNYAVIPIEGRDVLTAQAEVPLPNREASLSSRWRLALMQDLDESMEPVRAARRTRAVAGVIFAIIGSGIGYLFAIFLSRRIGRLARIVQEFGGGDYAKRATVSGSDEIGQLGAAFNQMADAIQRREIELQQWSSTLDRLVKDRTSELMQANESLQQEITERRRIQFEVMLERIRLEALIESSYDGLILIGTDNQIQVINQTALRLLDLPGIPQDWLGYRIGELRETDDSTMLDGLKRLREVDFRDIQQPVRRGEFQLENSVVQWVSLPVEAEEVPFGRLTVLHDVTQARMLETLRDDLIHTMVHDLRNPLGSLTVALELFQDDPVTVEQKQMITIAKESLNRMAAMVNAILDIGRLEAGSMPLERVAVPMREISNEIMSIQQPLAQQKNLTLVHDISDELPMLDVDRDLIGRVVQNLVGNAIKFTPNDGTITLAAAPQDGVLLVTVSDTGPGIAQDVRERLFQKFATGKQKGRGSGLGLAFSRLAIEAHGGHIWVESSTKEGTTFKFTLPFVQEAEGASQNATREGQRKQVGK